MRRPYIAGNWKLWGTRAEAAAYCERLVALLPDATRRGGDVAICVPFTALDVCATKLRGTEVRVCAQTMHQAETGAFTGEVSAPMLTELGVDGVVLGHSERRQYFGETDRALQEKVPAALAAGPAADPLRRRDRGGARGGRHRAQAAPPGAGGPGEGRAPERLPEVVIAYEPIWAIGTGQVATPEQAQDAIAFVRALVADQAPDAAEQVRVLYGGSVKPENAAEILAQPDVDGALVGGASLDPDSLARIVAAVPSEG